VEVTPTELLTYRFTHDLFTAVEGLQRGTLNAELVYDPTVGCYYVAIPKVPTLPKTG
jgi:hypothetical protein